MVQLSAFHLEKFPAFLRRVLDLNAVHNPEDPIHAVVGVGHDEWQGYLEANEGAKSGSFEANAIRTRRDLAAIHAEFPSGAPLFEQAAYLVRAFTGLRPFAEGNHLTGWDYMAELIEHNGARLLAGEEDGRALGNDLWAHLQALYPDGFSRQHLLERDEIFRTLSVWFSHEVA